MTHKRILYLLQQPPYLNHRVFEAFDALLVAAAFDQEVSVLFRGAGVTQLLAHQQPENQRNLAKILTSLDAYEVSNVYAEATAFESHNLQLADCAIEPTLLPAREIAILISRQDLVLND